MYKDDFILAQLYWLTVPLWYTFTEPSWEYSFRVKFEKHWLRREKAS